MQNNKSILQKSQNSKIEASDFKSEFLNEIAQNKSEKESSITETSQIDKVK